MKHLGRQTLSSLLLPVMALGLFLVYQTTLCPTVYMGDSGELTAAAASLGIPHNSGYPVYCLVGKLFCLLPLGNIAFRINLMSTVFAVLTICLVYDFVHKLTRSRVASFVGAFALAFVPLFWSQTVCAEVYTLHAFFVALLIRLLWWWDENRNSWRLAVLVFIAGLSLTNHMQTVMLAPAILYLVLSGNHRLLLRPSHLITFFLLFALALSIYLYLPLRTNAGAAIHWGDPNNLIRFWAHVSAKAHRQGYVMTRDLWGYTLRFQELIGVLISQLGVLLILAVWGWIKLSYTRWKLFFLILIISDLSYSLFLNIISPKITPFCLPSSIALTALAGAGIADMFDAFRRRVWAGTMVQRTVKVGFSLIPVLLLILNYQQCNQSRNYLAYEHTLNIFRTVTHGATLWLDGDNNIFPVTYARIVEDTRPDVNLYDRHNIVFKFNSATGSDAGHPESADMRPESGMATSPKRTYIAAFNPSSWYDRFSLYPSGILYRTSPTGRPEDSTELWKRYATQSLYDPFYKDFMNRQVCAYFHFSRGKYLFASGRPTQGLEHLDLASQVGYDDTTIHSDIAMFLTERGLFDEARAELEKALVYHDDLSGIYNNWGYYFYKKGDYNDAVKYYQKAIQLNPEDHGYYNNLGLAFYDAGIKKEALHAFGKSIKLEPDQPNLLNFLNSIELNPHSTKEKKFQGQKGSSFIHD